MVTGSLKRPKLDFLLGVSKAQAVGNIDRLMQKCTNEKHTKADREVLFCGVPLFATIVHSGEESEQHLFVAKYVTAKFSLTKTDCLENRQAIEGYYTTIAASRPLRAADAAWGPIGLPHRLISQIYETWYPLVYQYGSTLTEFDD